MDRGATEMTEEWITTNEAVDATGYSAEYLRQMARENKVETQKFAGRWLFNEDNLLDHKHKMDALGRKKHALWQNREYSEA